MSETVKKKRLKDTSVRKIPDRKLPSDVKEQWLTALRSGEYSQVTGRLWKLDPNGKKCHCCLGVLGEVTGIRMPPSVHMWDESDSGLYTSLYGARKDLVLVLRQELKEKRAIIQSVQGHLSGLNDDGTPFEEIAQWIEENL